MLLQREEVGQIKKFVSCAASTFLDWDVPGRTFMSYPTLLPSVGNVPSSLTLGSSHSLSAASPCHDCSCR